MPISVYLSISGKMAEGGTDEDKEVTEALQELDIRGMFTFKASGAVV